MTDEDYVKINSKEELKDEIKYYRPSNVDFSMTRLPNNIYNYLLEECEKIQNNFENYKKWNDRLVGHIKKEYDMSHCIEKIQDFIMPIAIKYIEKYNLTPIILNKNLPYFIENIWINFQKKYEFNPPHNHSGVVSFVIWIKIPYNLEDENKVFSDVEHNQTSKFGFLYTNLLGQISITTIPVDKNYEGVICFFPSKLTHYVNPFYTSDDYRISISGNIRLKTN